MKSTFYPEIKFETERTKVFSELCSRACGFGYIPQNPNVSIDSIDELLISDYTKYNQDYTIKEIIDNNFENVVLFDRNFISALVRSIDTDNNYLSNKQLFSIIVDKHMSKLAMINKEQRLGYLKITFLTKYII